MFFKISAGYFVEIDDDDYCKIAGKKWTARINKRSDKTKRVYAYRQERKNGISTMIYMHRLLMGFPANMDVDHIDGNTLNNKKSNLQICSRSKNISKSKSHIDRKYDLPKGIEYRPNRKNKYSARICIEGVRHCLGSYFTIEEALEAYNRKNNTLHL